MEFTKEQVREQIKKAKDKYKAIYWKVFSAEYNPNTRQLQIVMINTNSSNGESELYYFDVENIKFLKDRTDEEIAKVSLLGGRAIQWEELDIQIGLEKLLMSVQLLEEWVESLK